jgi:hypothetical protein
MSEAMACYESAELGFNPHRVILLSTEAIRKGLTDLRHEEEEWGVGVPASMTVTETLGKESRCKEWNSFVVNGRPLMPGDLLIPKRLEMEVCFLDGRGMGTISFQENEILTVTTVSYDRHVRQFVFKSNGSKPRNYLPIDWEMFRHFG